MSSESSDPGSDSVICFISEATANADVDGIAVAAASEFCPATGGFLSGPNSVLVASDIAANLCFRAFLHVPRVGLRSEKTNDPRTQESW